MDANSSLDSSRFCLGELFSSYRDLQTKVKAYEKQAAVQLTHRDSRTLEGMKARAPKRVKVANPQLVYYSICLCCVFGGKVTRTKAQGREERNSECLTYY